MKNNLDFYQHHVNSHNHWKFKYLRRLYVVEFKEISDPEGWAGEGKFWALNNMIAESENSQLNTTEEGKMETISSDLGFTLEQLNKYLDLLINKCKLVRKNGEFLTTKRTNIILSSVQESRERDRARKQKSKPDSDRNNELSDRKNELSDRNNTNFRPEKEQSKVKESKGKESNTISPSDGEKKVVGIKPKDEIKNLVEKKKKVAPKKKGKNPDAEPYWHLIRKKWIWFNKTHVKFNVEPIPERDYSHIHRIIEKLRLRAVAQAVEWTEENALMRWEKFLTIAFTKDTWLHDNFLAGNLESKMQKVFNLIDNPNGQHTKTGRQGPTSSSVGKTIEFDRP